MRIISKFHDYYDVGQSLGQDLSIVYVRTTIEEEQQYYKTRRIPQCGYEPVTIGFCGNLYPAKHFFYRANGQNLSAWCYSVEDCDKFIAQIKNEYDRDLYFKSPYSWGRIRRGKRTNWEYSVPTQKGMVDSFAMTRDLSHMIKQFHTHNSPIIVWEPWKKIVNPLLRPYEFYRIKEPYTAFQEVQQYVSGTLNGPVNPIPTVPDEIMQEIKGFDHKYSFRKEPRE